ncbi:MAG TPA: putative lipid II flippase FtsW [Desulfobacteraceae bacterium]|nr:putative lipid II flippase FtsW [Desulfobacteraceae bacterium]
MGTAIKGNKQKINFFRYDFKLIFPVIFLVGTGIIMIYSASSALALERFKGEYFFVQRQAVYALIGLAGMFFCAHFPYRYYQRLAYPLLILSIVLLILVFTPLGYSAGGARRWLYISGQSLQPLEFARFAMIIFLAYSLDKKQNIIKTFSRGLLPHFLLLGIFTGLIMFQPDFGGVTMLWVVTLVILFAGRVCFLHLSFFFALMLPAAFCFIFFSNYRLRRFLAFIDPWKYKQDGGHHIIQSLIAFDSGGVWGAGVGKSLQKLFYLPEPHTDFIFSIVGEELGLCGVLLIIIIYSFILWKGLMISNNAPDLFGSLLAIGITASIGLQAFTNMGVTMGVLPTKGLTLPFLSYGGTSLLIFMASMGILMNIGRSSKK